MTSPYIPYLSRGGRPTPQQPDPPSADLVLAAMAYAPNGTKAGALAKVLHTTYHDTLTVLRQLRDRGLVVEGPIFTGLWFLPDQLPEEWRPRS